MRLILKFCSQATMFDKAKKIQILRLSSSIRTLMVNQIPVKFTNPDQKLIDNLICRED